MSTQYREPSEPERSLLQALLAQYDVCSADWLNDLLVTPMEDGEMGSLRLRLRSTTEPDPKFGRRLAEVQFTDVDGVTVIASLNLSEQGLPFEMDVWKTDFSPLTRVPYLEPGSPE